MKKKKAAQKSRNSLKTYQKTIRRLEAENIELQAQVELLREELANLQGKSRRVEKKQPGYATVEQQATAEYLFSRKNYFSYIYTMIRRTSVFNIYTKIIQFVRRYTFLTTTVQIITAVLLALQSSAIFVLATSAFVISIPITIFISHAAVLFTVFERKRKISEVRKLVKDKKLTVYFPTKGRAFEQDSFFCGMVRENAANEGCFSVVVTPYFMSMRGIGEQKSPFMIARQEQENILIIRRHFYFALKKKIIDPMEIPTAEVF